MGLFSMMREANEEAHGTRLRQHLDDTLMRMAQLNDQVRGTALMRFADKREKLLSNLPNMSKEGVIKMGRFLQSKARETFDLNIAEGYALWLTGAWAESMQRESGIAQGVHEQLDELAEGLSECVEEELDDSEDIEDAPKFSSFHEWLHLFKYSAAQVNPGLEVREGSSLIDFMDLTPLRRAFDDGVDPMDLGREFGLDFDLGKMLGK